MNVLVTVIALAVLGMWWFAVYNRLVRLRERVKLAWRHLEGDQTNESAKTVYNRSVEAYNEALAAFPANVVAMASGFKPAHHFQTLNS